MDSPAPARSGRRLVSVAGLLVAVLMAWANGIAVRWFAAQFQLFGETADRGDHLVGAGACAATAALLFAALVAMFVFGPPWWLLVTTAVGVGTQLAFSITSYRQAQGLISAPGDDTFADGVRGALLLPGSWPLLVVMVVAVVVGVRRGVRARSSREPPAPRAR